METVIDIKDFQKSEEIVADSADFSDITSNNVDGLSELGLNLRNDFNFFRI